MEGNACKGKPEATAVEVRVRRSVASDFRITESLIREAFWNQYCPGCCEHYLLHLMRWKADFVRALDLVAETNGVWSAIRFVSYLACYVIAEWSGRRSRLAPSGSCRPIKARASVGFCSGIPGR